MITIILKRNGVDNVPQEGHLVREKQKRNITNGFGQKVIAEMDWRSSVIYVLSITFGMLPNLIGSTPLLQFHCPLNLETDAFIQMPK